MNKLVATASLLAVLSAPAAALAADTRPGAVSFSPGSAKVTRLSAGARTGVRSGPQSKDDTGTTIILMAAAGVGGYFLHDIIDDDNNNGGNPGSP